MASPPRIKIECKGINKSFMAPSGQLRVLENVSFAIPDNEFVVLLGPGQCGKTTLLNCIGGLIAPDSGEVLLNGKPLEGPGPDRGIVFQQYALMPWKTVEENVAFGLAIKGIEKKERLEKAKKYISLVGLDGFEKSYPHELSGGMRQRVGIARAYTNDPDVLLMDEPFGALDAQTRYAMEKELLSIWEKDKRTVLFVTNNIEEAIYLGDRVIVMTKMPGRIKSEHPITIPKPRDYTNPDFLSWRKRISEDTELVL